MKEQKTVSRIKIIFNPEKGLAETWFKYIVNVISTIIKRINDRIIFLFLKRKFVFISKSFIIENTFHSFILSEIGTSQ